MWSVKFCETIKNDLKSTKEVQNLRTTHKVNFHGLLLLHLISPPLYMITFSPSFKYIPTKIKFLQAAPNKQKLLYILLYWMESWDTFWFSKKFHVQIF